MEPDSHADSHSFLAGCGEMGERIRAFDWSNTPLGPVVGWPQSLRVTLSLILNSGVPMFLFWGPELIYFYNDAYRPSLSNVGRHPAALGQRVETVYPETWPSIKPLLDNVLSNGNAIWHEDQLTPVYHNGQIVDVYWTVNYSPVRDESGRPAGVFGACVETAGKATMSQHLEDVRSQLIFAIDAADLGTWDLNPVTNRFIGNARLKEWFGLVSDEKIELDFALNAIADADRPRVVQAITTALQPGSGGGYDVVYRIANAVTGQERTVRAKGRAYFDETGTADRFASTTQDVTEQLLTREQVKQAEQMTQLAVAGAGIFFIDLVDDRIVYSPVLARIFTGSETAGLTRNSLLTYILPEDRPVRDKAYQLAAKTGKLNYKARTVWDDGATHWLRVFGAYLFDYQGVATGFSGIALDITSQRIAQEELERLVQERTKDLSYTNQTLIRTNHGLEQFAFIASHDLQEPLRKIQSFADLLQANRHDTDLFDLYLGKITKSAQRMSALIKAVLEYSRLAAKNDLFEEIDLNQILQNILVDFDLLIEQKGAIVRSDTLPTLTGIPLQLTQLFTNLVGNALKFTDKNPRIEISSTRLSPEEAGLQPGLNPALTYVRITIQDNGIGFDLQYAERIFALFQRLSNGKAYGGTGIGLALCRKIVENHSGFITAEGATGQGAAFHVYLPG